MRIKIIKTDYLYEILSYTSRMRQDEGEAWKQTNDNSDRLRNQGGYRYEPVHLPLPFTNAGLIAYRMDKFYRAFVYICTRNPKVFEDTMQGLHQGFKKVNKIFLPTSTQGSGHILTAANAAPAISIIPTGENDENREICIGRGGSMLREFGDSSDFRIDMGELENATNIFLEECTQSAIRKGVHAEALDLIYHMNP